MNGGAPPQPVIETIVASPQRHVLNIRQDIASIKIIVQGPTQLPLDSWNKDQKRRGSAHPTSPAGAGCHHLQPLSVK